MRQIVEVIGRALQRAACARSGQTRPADFYGPLAMFAGLDMPASSVLTQKWLDWKPAGIGLIADIGQPDYFAR